MKTRAVVVIVPLLAGMLALNSFGPRAYASDDDKKEKKVIGSNKATGGEAPTDRPRMEDIKDGSKNLKDRVEKERKDRGKKNSGNG